MKFSNPPENHRTNKGLAATALALSALVIPSCYSHNQKEVQPEPKAAATNDTRDENVHAENNSSLKAEIQALLGINSGDDHPFKAALLVDRSGWISDPETRLSRQVQALKLTDQNPELDLAQALKAVWPYGSFYTTMGVPVGELRELYKRLGILDKNEPLYDSFARGTIKFEVYLDKDGKPEVSITMMARPHELQVQESDEISKELPYWSSFVQVDAVIGEQRKLVLYSEREVLTAQSSENPAPYYNVLKGSLADIYPNLKDGDQIQLKVKIFYAPEPGLRDYAGIADRACEETIDLTVDGNELVPTEFIRNPHLANQVKAIAEGLEQSRDQTFEAQGTVQALFGNQFPPVFKNTAENRKLKNEDDRIILLKDQVETKIPATHLWDGKFEKPTIIIFSAAWCEPCLMERKEIEAYAASNTDIQVVILNKGSDPADWFNIAKEVNTKSKLKYAVIDGGWEQLGIESIPTKTLVKTDGKVIAVKVGTGIEGFKEILMQAPTKSK